MRRLCSESSINVLAQRLSGWHSACAFTQPAARATAIRGRPRHPVLAEIIEIVFEPGRPIVPERPFDAGARGPADPDFAGTEVERSWRSFET
jgi:hypothetical protein